MKMVASGTHLNDQKAPTAEYAELKRRFGFEFDGMVLHEYYFQNIKKGSGDIPQGSALAKAATASFGSVQTWWQDFMATAKLPGVGWVICCQDPASKRLFNTWVSMHQDGNVSGLPRDPRARCVGTRVHARLLGDRAGQVSLGVREVRRLGSVGRGGSSSEPGRSRRCGPGRPGPPSDSRYLVKARDPHGARLHAAAAPLARAARALRGGARGSSSSPEGARSIVGVSSRRRGCACGARRYSWKPPAELDGFTIAQLTDFHGGPFLRARDLAPVVELVNGLGADAIALTGDFITNKTEEGSSSCRGSPGSRAARDLRRLRKPRLPRASRGELERELGKLGIRALRNAHAEVAPGLAIAGIEDLEEGKFADLDAALAGIPPGTAVVLLSHHPGGSSSRRSGAYRWYCRGTPTAGKSTGRGCDASAPPIRATGSSAARRRCS